MLPASRAYDALYRIWQITDGRSNTTAFGHDAVGNPSTVAYPGGTGLIWGFDPNHNINRRTDGIGRITNYILDPVDSRLSDVDYPSGTDPHFDYDNYGRVTQMTDSTGTVIYTYDDNDLVTSVTTTYGGLSPKIVSYTYYPDGSRKSMTLSGLSGSPSSLAFNYTYFYDATEQGRVVKVSAPWMTGSTQNQCIYNQNGQIVLQKSPRVQTRYTYNARGFMASLSNNPTGTGSPESHFTDMQYDAAGDLNQLSYNVPAAWSGKQLTGTLYYIYDELNRLTGEQRVDGDSAYSYDVSFTPDAADNLTLVRDLGLSFDSDDQVIGYGYDDNGNVTSCRGYGFGYDYEDLPTSVTGGMYGNVTMQYRTDGLRAWKSSNNGGWFSYYFYDGDTVLCELDSSGGLSEAYLYGGNGLIQRRGGTSAYYTYTFDPLGSHVQTHYYSGSTSQVQRFSIYDAFGKRWSDKTASGGNTNIPGPFGFGAQWGGYTDHETRQAQTDTPLVLMGVRYYDPITARFMSRDPVVGANAYAYCWNNPIVNIDAEGQKSSGGTLSKIGHFIANIPSWICRKVFGVGKARNNPTMQDAYIDKRLLDDPLIAETMRRVPRAGTAVCAYTVQVENEIGWIVISEGASRAFSTMSAFRRAFGSAGEGSEWHHIVEARNAERFGSEAIQNTRNIVKLPASLHQKISRLYSRIMPEITGSKTITVRKWLKSQPYEQQYRFGLRAIEKVRQGMW